MNLPISSFQSLIHHGIAFAFYELHEVTSLFVVLRNWCHKSVSSIGSKRQVIWWWFTRLRFVPVASLHCFQDGRVIGQPVKRLFLRQVGERGVFARVLQITCG